MAQAKKSAEAGLTVSATTTADDRAQFEDRFVQAVSHFEPVLPMPVIPMDEAWMFNDCQMPLPMGMVPGEYRAVSNTGLVREFKVTLDDRSKGNTASKNAPPNRNTRQRPWVILVVPMNIPFVRIE